MNTDDILWYRHLIEEAEKVEDIDSQRYDDLLEEMDLLWEEMDSESRDQVRAYLAQKNRKTDEPNGKTISAGPKKVR